MSETVPEAAPEVACWNTAAAIALLESEEWFPEAKLRDGVQQHIKIEPQATNEGAFLEFLVNAYNTYLERGDYEAAYGYGVFLYRDGREDLGAPLVYESGYLLAREELTKAEDALQEKDYRRASDKGVWAAAHFGDAIRAGRFEAEDEFYAAAAIAFEGNAYYGGSTDAIEEPILEDCRKLELPLPTELLRAIRCKAYEDARRDETRTDIRADIMYRHAKALEALGVAVPAMARTAAVMGVRDYLNSRNEHTTIFIQEFLETLQQQGFPEEGFAELKLTVARTKYCRQLRSAEHAHENDIPAWHWFATAAAAVELVNLGDESGKDKILHALHGQVATINREYFTHGDSTGVDIHFDRYAEAGLISSKQSARLKKALQVKLIAVREQLIADGLQLPARQWDQEVLDRIDESIRDYT